MKFPGSRKSKHYFPVSECGRIQLDNSLVKTGKTYIVGIDQLLVDIEVHVSDEFLTEFQIDKGESQVVSDETVQRINERIENEELVTGIFPGGSIGNTLHNYSVISDGPSIALGSISENISVGDDAFKYICSTSSKVDFNYLKPCPGKMGRAFCFITPDGERSFALSKGIMNELSEDFIPEKVIANSSAVLISAFLLRNPDSPIFKATIKALHLANEYGVPTLLSLGTSFLIKERPEFFLNLIKDHINIIAGNIDEYHALFSELDKDSLLLAEKSLDYADLCLLTVGARGLYLCGHTDKEVARETKDQIHSKSIPAYNMYEYSRAMLKKNCQEPLKIYTHINPFLGGPQVIKNTNGAGDAAMSALLHDISSNTYHRDMVPNSPKHNASYLTYSSIHQVSKYCNRVSYEVLSQSSPRLSKGLPDKEDCLEEGYWAK